MTIRSMFVGAAVAALAALPAAALADLQVTANGFHRVVTDTGDGPSCHVHRVDGATSVRCADGTKGTMVLYRHSSESPVCQLDFWPQTSGSGSPKWRVQMSHQDTAYGTCTTKWDNGTTLELTLQPSS